MRFFAVLAALIVPLAAYYPVNQEREKTIETQEKQIKERDMQIEQAKAAERKLAQFYEEVRRRNGEVAKSRRILPPDPALNEIRDVVDGIAETSGIRIDRF